MFYSQWWMMKVKFCALGFITVLGLCFGLMADIVHAIEPDELLDDPQLEREAREISANLRCLVCQNQSIDDSDADLAKDMRRLVREQLLEGKSRLEIENYLVLRYGDFVLLRPTMTWKNVLLWASPFTLILLGFVLVMRYFNRQEKANADKDNQALSDDEIKIVTKLLKG